MKSFFKLLGWLLLLGVVTTAVTFVVMKHVHKNTYKQEAIEWIPALEKVLDKEETSKDEDIVIEVETPTEETDPTEDEIQTE